MGPTWVGLAGSERELQDGSTVVADDAYLVRAIAEPGADLLADYQLQMPQNRLTDEDIADVIAYIKDLSQPARRLIDQRVQGAVGLAVPGPPVSTCGPSSVTRIVCSNWAVRLPSEVTAVQSSSQIL